MTGINSETNTNVSPLDEEDRLVTKEEHIVNFAKILAEIDASPTKNLALYENLVSNLGSEFDILLKKPLTEIEKYGSEKLKKAIEIVRKRQVKIDPGYDGVFGKVKVFDESTKEHDETQSALF